MDYLTFAADNARRQFGPEDQEITYTLSVTIKRAVRPYTDYAGSMEDAAEWMTGKDAKRELEREVLRALRALDGDYDCEVIDVSDR